MAKRGFGAGLAWLQAVEITALAGQPAFFDEEFGSIVKQAYEDILETSSTSTLTSTNKISSTTDSSSYLLNYDGFQYDVGMNSSLSLLSSENDKDITKNSVGYIQCNSNIQICEVNDIIMVL